MKRTFKALAICLCLALGISGCSTASAQTVSNTSDTETASETAVNTTGDTTSSDSTAVITSTVIDPSDMFTDRDKEVGYDEDECVQIQLQDTTAVCTSDAVTVTDQTVTITEEGIYLISGTLSDGMLLIDAADTDKVRLIFDGVSITDSTSAALYVREADKVFITLAPGSENTLSNGGTYTAIDDNNIDAVIFSKSDLTLNGSGSLTIQAAAGHGIVSKDDLVVTGGTYTITAASHGLSGKDSIRIADGSFTITSGKDGLHAENTDDTSLGFLYIAGGSFHLTSEGDGISAANTLQIDDGSFTLQTGGGSSTVDTSNTTMDMGRSFGQTNSSTSSDEETVSTKGIKSAADLLINDGQYNIDAADDALHSNDHLTVNGGTFDIQTGDDGMHADADLTIGGGTIRILTSYEGLEGLTITISGGEIDLTSSDDGLNAAGGNDASGYGAAQGFMGGMDSFDADSDASIEISDGVLYIAAEGDGIDSNGSLTISGGEIYVSGPTSGGNGSLDYGTDAVISGGIFIAAGSSQMAQNFGSNSTQGCLMTTVSSQEAGSTITLTDAGGQSLISWQPETTYECVIISCPELIQGETYTLTAGNAETTITMDSLVYGSGTGMGGMGGGMNGGMKGGMNGDMQNDQESGSFPGRGTRSGDTAPSKDDTLPENGSNNSQTDESDGDSIENNLDTDSSAEL